MNLYLDDDSAKGKLLALLRQAGHGPWSPAELHDVVQVTQGIHYGILVIRSDNDPRRDMTGRSIVNAIGRLEPASVPIRNEMHILNHWR